MVCQTIECQPETHNNMKAKQSLNRPASEINRAWLLKVYGVDASGLRVNKLVGVSGMVALIGVEMFNKLLLRADRCMGDVCHCKLRRGLRVSFYNH